MNRSIVNNAGDVIHQRESMTLKVLWEYVLLGGEKPWMTKTEKVDDGSRKYSYSHYSTLLYSLTTCARTIHHSTAMPNGGNGFIRVWDV